MHLFQNIVEALDNLPYSELMVYKKKQVYSKFFKIEEKLVRLVMTALNNIAPDMISRVLKVMVICLNSYKSSWGVEKISAVEFF